MTGAEYRLCNVSFDRTIRGKDTRIERELALAVIDLLESNSFIPIGHAGGPYRLRIETADGRLALHIADDGGRHVVSHYLSMTPFRRLLRDYNRICESYYDSMCRPGFERLQAIDMGRRGIHNEAAELLRRRLAAKVNIDQDTARHLFTLIYALIMRNTDHRILLS
ncbi:UPF0262 family protein [Mesorhizobium dulcispinae]|uniref:UPF0262 family protein n=1 Tax=Mesorhizobium dulcispinae TaxID=3072316 RepID=UPI002A24282F|nr:UPF0262 family protein [Mesorhizobium sp. VK23D]MDX8522772.1 UPF0262 family protein [Mesorhizobium sp. VK23D]